METVACPGPLGGSASEACNPFTLPARGWKPYPGQGESSLGSIANSFHRSSPRKGMETTHDVLASVGVEPDLNLSSFISPQGDGNCSPLQHDPQGLHQSFHRSSPRKGMETASAYSLGWNRTSQSSLSSFISPQGDGNRGHTCSTPLLMRGLFHRSSPRKGMETDDNKRLTPYGLTFIVHLPQGDGNRTNSTVIASF